MAISSSRAYDKRQVSWRGRSTYRGLHRKMMALMSSMYLICPLSSMLRAPWLPLRANFRLEALASSNLSICVAPPILSVDLISSSSNMTECKYITWWPKYRQISLLKEKSALKNFDWSLRFPKWRRYPWVCEAEKSRWRACPGSILTRRRPGEVFHLLQVCTCPCWRRPRTETAVGASCTRRVATLVLSASSFSNFSQSKIIRNNNDENALAESLNYNSYVFAIVKVDPELDHDTPRAWNTVGAFENSYVQRGLVKFLGYLKQLP